MTNNQQYKVSITEFHREDDELKAQALYEQTVTSLDIRAVINAVNAAPDPQINILPAPRKRAPRSDKGQKRKPVPIVE